MLSKVSRVSLPQILMTSGLLLSATSAALLVQRFASSFKVFGESNKIIIITGCDSGFGLLAAVELSRLGFYVMSTCMTEAGIERLKGIVGDVMLCDVTNEEQVRQLFEMCDQKVKCTEMKLWALVNNAGIAPLGLLDWVSMESVVRAMDVNYFGTVRMIKSALPLLKQSKESRIVNVSSLAGLTSMMYMGAYCASKHAVEGMTKALRSELRPWNIHVCNVNPGFARTPMIAAGKLSAKDAFSKASREIQYQYNDSDMDSIAALVESNAIEPALVVSKILSCVYAPCPALNNIVNGYLTLPTRIYCSLPTFVQEFLSGFVLRGGPRPEVVLRLQGDAKSTNYF